MKKFIVTTTIQSPTLATIKFSGFWDWNLIIVGDQKTPHKEYENKDWIYLSPEYQEKAYPKLSKAIGWNCIMRRNIGFIEAYKMGADVVATVDDDNIPYDDWGVDLKIGKLSSVHVYDSPIGVVDPMKFTNYDYLWHRGFPIDRVYESHNVKWITDRTQETLIEASFWNGDPDVDALCRLMYNPKDLLIKQSNSYFLDAFTSNNYMPFNSQNTFLAREVLPVYMVLPYIGRSDDIWGGYIAQYLLNIRPVFTRPTVYQERNEQSIYKNLQDELLGYRYTSSLLNNIENWPVYLPSKTEAAFNIYREEYKNLD